MAKLYYFRCEKPNFGDELNPWLWPRLAPQLLDDDDGELFLGIGTILNDGLPAAPRKLVFGSGYGYGNPPSIDPEKWRFHCVRGPLTARALGLPPELAVCDPAILLRRLPWPVATRRYPVSFIPHWESLDRGHWAQVCEYADVHFIDPTAPVEQVVAEIRGSELVIAEAMHGAIVSDAMRVPWIAVDPQLHMHSPKWLDWCASINVPYKPLALRPSGWAESCSGGYRRLRRRFGSGAQAALTGLRGRSVSDTPPAPPNAPATEAPGRRHALRVLELLVERPVAAVGKAVPAPLARRLDEPFLQAAARDLRAISRARPTLSADTRIESLTEDLEERWHRLCAQLSARADA